MSDETLITGPLYAARKKNYPQSVQGRFRTIKWRLLFLTLGIYYLTPFLRWNRGPNLPDQAVLIDLPHRRFYFFFIQLWPQEIYFFTGLLVIAAMALFLMNALAGRIWCGYLCPQTVWTDLFYAVERFVEGDRRDRIAKDKGGWTVRHIRETALKHFLWVMIAWWTGGAWVLYFADAPKLVRDLATFHAPLIAYLSIGVLTATTYVFAGHMREQVCIYMCPWPRIQAALTDEWALNVTYLNYRGEPRMSVKKAEMAHAHGAPAGDCIDCHQCVNVCPTGIDIREGIQLGCIQCGLCIDACDHVMTQIGRPAGLIGYDTDINQNRYADGKPPVFRLIRARTILYACIIALVGAIMAVALATRRDVILSAQHERNPLSVTLSNGSVRNDYTVHVSNKTGMPRKFELSLTGLPGASLTIVGDETAIGAVPVAEVAADDVREFRLLVSVPPSSVPKEPVPVTIIAKDVATGEAITAADHFIAATH